MALLYMKQKVNDKTNCQQIILLSIILKIFEKALYEQLQTVANKMFPPKLCDVEKDTIRRIPF